METVECYACGRGMLVMGRRQRRDFGRVSEGLHIRGNVVVGLYCRSCGFHFVQMDDGESHLVPGELLAALAFGLPAGRTVVHADVTEAGVRLHPL